MSFLQTVLLGALAGATIFIGLPIGRLPVVSAKVRVALAMFAVGILAFLFVDILEHGLGIVDGAVAAFHAGKEGIGRAIGLAALLCGGFAAGAAGLATFERRARRAAVTPPPMAGGAVDALPPSEIGRMRPETGDAARRVLRVGMTIAAAIGLHNFAEGLAIGVSASTGEITLATVLIVGFALHNATEGFGIVGPVCDARPSWRWLAVAGLVGGGPTFLGTVVGYQLNSQPLELAFYAVAGGAVLYVIGEVWNAMRRFGHRELGLWVLAAGFAAGVITDLIVSYGGG